MSRGAKPWCTPTTTWPAASPAPLLGGSRFPPSRLISSHTPSTFAPPHPLLHSWRSDRGGWAELQQRRLTLRRPCMDFSDDKSMERLSTHPGAPRAPCPARSRGPAYAARPAPLPGGSRCSPSPLLSSLLHPPVRRPIPSSMAGAASAEAGRSSGNGASLSAGPKWLLRRRIYGKVGHAARSPASSRPSLQSGPSPRSLPSHGSHRCHRRDALHVVRHQGWVWGARATTKVGPPHCRWGGPPRRCEIRRNRPAVVLRTFL
jgi:hypothetical protein